MEHSPTIRRSREGGDSMSIVRMELWCYCIRVTSHGLDKGIRVHGISRKGIHNEVIEGEGRQIRGRKR